MHFNVKWDSATDWESWGNTGTRGRVACVHVCVWEGERGVETVIVVSQFVLKRMINPSLWFCIHLTGCCSRSVYCYMCVCDSAQACVSLHMQAWITMCSEQAWVLRVILYGCAYCIIVYSLYTRVWRTRALFCVCACTHLPVEYPHSDLWECKMSNTAHVPLFLRNIISYFYMEFTLVLTALSQPPLSSYSELHYSLLCILKHSTLHTPGSLPGGWKWQPL